MMGDMDTGLDLDAAESFLAASARVLDNRRFHRLFRGGQAQPVRDAVAAYRNADGGFGNALEPDCRAPGSQPAAAEMALRIMHECDAWDAELALGVCDWLASIAPEEGGAAFVEGSLAGWPHAPWWAPADGHPANLTTTGLISGTLLARGVRHPWLDGATEVMWARIEALSDGGPYDMYGVLGFLEQVPDAGRARRALDRIGPLIMNVVTLDPDAPGETHGPLDFAPRPDSLARRLFDDDVIKTNLDHLARGQKDDGGWTFNWPAWSPAAERDWRGFVTVAALRVLRAYGVIASP